MYDWSIYHTHTHRSLASHMRVVESPEDFLSSPERLLPDYALFRCTLNCTMPSNALILLSSQQLNISPNVTDATNFTSNNHAALPQSEVKVPIPWPVELDTYEYFFKVPYSVMNISAELADFWSTVGSDFDTLSLSGDNSFIVGNLSIQEKPDNSTVPVTISKDEGISFWSLLDTKDFPEPRVNFRCDFRSSDTETSLTREG